ncbi:MAG TPA: TrmH family RNA methyltransferase [Candidatus Thalassarchaeaceae archaeon]|nr:TrmH family RNA methyltransferase [Candidatus Thalassarchaeaceae archaeon]
MQRCGVEEVSHALGYEQVSLVLFLKDSLDPEAVRLRESAESRGIPVLEASNNDMWRMSRVNEDQTPPPILALVGRNPSASVDDVLASGGVSWLLAGARYPVNIGFTIRTAEVSGASAVFVDGDLSHTEKKAAKRASMKAHRFMPVHWVEGDDIVRRAKEAGFRVVSIEDCGEIEPWEEVLTGDVLLIVGGERDGIPDSILGKSDSVIRVPMSGFVPSYNLQAPMAVVAAEALRQRRNAD